MRVLVLTGFYLPGYKGGGPIKTIKNLINEASTEVSFRIITSDRDLGDLLPYPSVSCGDWIDTGKASILYAPLGARGFFQILKILKEEKHELVYLNSFFSFRFSFAPLLLAKIFRRRIILAPRGEFSNGALSIKPLKKLIFIFLYKFFRFHVNVIFQASSYFEAKDIYKIFGQDVDIRIAEDIGAQDFCDSFPRRKVGPLQAVFISRISSMKNLLLAIEVLANAQEPVNYDIYGPIEDEYYWAECQQAIELLPFHISVSYKGELLPDNVIKTLANYDVFFLPTKGENYGHVIAEAFCAALPVVVADTTPWRNLHQLGIGWDLSLSNPDTFSMVLDELATMPPEKYQEMRERVLVWAKNKFSQRDAVEANIALFRYAYDKN